MRKKGKIILVVIILIIIGVVSFIIYNKIKNKDVDLTQKLYDNLTKAQNYSFTMILDSKNKTTMAKRNDETAIDTYSSEEGHRTTIIKEDTTYYVLHDREEYYVYHQTNIEQSILKDSIAEILNKEYVKGEEKVRGKKCSYQEYSGTTFFAVSIPIDVDEEKVKTRFYYDKDNNLTYIKTIYEEKEELLEIEMSNEVNNSIFEIPSNYAEN